MPLRTVSLDELTIDDEPAFAGVALYARLKAALRRSGHQFRLLPAGQPSWDRAVFLNLTYWSGEESADVLTDEHLAADVIAHIAWHHLAGRHLGANPAASASAMLFAESIASA